MREFELVLVAFFIIATNCLSAESAPGNSVPAPTSLPQDAVVIHIKRPMSPPAWAFYERKLLEENTRALRMFFTKYWDQRGYMKCIPRWSIVDGVDDVMETCGNWPLLYALGADADVLKMFKMAFEGHIKQYTHEEIEYAPQWGVLYKEFITAFDWQHNSEHYAAFNQLTLAAPQDTAFRSRLVRFAGFYRNEALPQGAENNYDFQYDIIRSAMNGSRGALLEMNPQYWGNKWPEIGKRPRLKNWTRVKGDIPVNLLSTTLATNAYICTGQKKYKNWALSYINAWCRRAAANNDIFPSNVGLSGNVGEHWNGKWWDCWEGRWSMFRGIRPSLENALLLTGKMRYMDVLRKQIRRLYENKVEINGKKYPPSHYDSNGWNGKGRYHRSLTRLFLTQFRPEDMKLIEEDLQRRGKHKFSYRTGFFYHVDDYAWLFFVLGKNPEFPRRMFESDIKRIRHRVEQMKRDNSEDWERRSDRAQRFQPVSTHTLINLTCGSIGPLWQSTPILAEAWHYDPTEARPGLPPDVGALVNSITKQGFSLQLVNLSQTQKRKIVVQMGAYGENKCIRVNFRGKKHPVDNHYFVVELGAGCGGNLQVEVDRFTNQPTAGLPWEK